MSLFRFRLLVAVSGLVLVAGVPGRAHAQVEIDNNFKYNSGQDVQPIFDGWSHAPDGGFAMHFGYLNRNYVQELSIPIGPGNSIEPEGPDRGQPTFFYTRTNRNVFTVVVPKDWGKKELVWTVTANGRTQKAIGWLQPEWEIDPAGGAQTGGRTDAEYRKNRPPEVTVKAASAVTLPSPLALSASVTDDGLPKPTPARKPAIGQETPPLLQGGADAPVNVPQLANATVARGSTPRGGGDGLTVTWIVWRGPAAATFDARVIPVKDGQAETTVRFSKAGEYVIRARASDRLLTSSSDVKVTVQGQ